MRKWLLFFLLCLLTTYLSGEESSSSLQSYLLSPEHPLKAKLDAIFTKSRVLLSVETMKQAGFKPVIPRKFTRLIVSTHPDLKGYIVKVYLDTQRRYKQKPEYFWWKKRIEGAKAITAFIEKKGLSHLYKVPKKWIYQLPEFPPAPLEFEAKNTILVEEDMDLLSAEDNKHRWKSEAITVPLLSSLQLILTEIGLRDCCKIDNIPFAKDGRIAFIDTQSFNAGKPPLKRLKKFLGEKQKVWWERIMSDRTLPKD